MCTVNENRRREDFDEDAALKSRMLPFLLQISLLVVTKSAVVALVESQTEEEGRGRDRLPGSLVRKGRKQEEGIGPLTHG